MLACEIVTRWWWRRGRAVWWYSRLSWHSYYNSQQGQDDNVPATPEKPNITHHNRHPLDPLGQKKLRIPSDGEIKNCQTSVRCEHVTSGKLSVFGGAAHSYTGVTCASSFVHLARRGVSGAGGEISMLLILTLCCCHQDSNIRRHLQIAFFTLSDLENKNWKI